VKVTAREADLSLEVWLPWLQESMQNNSKTAIEGKFNLMDILFIE
jgi:hypothetical protein